MAPLYSPVFGVWLLLGASIRIKGNFIISGRPGNVKRSPKIWTNFLAPCKGPAGGVPIHQKNKTKTKNSNKANSISNLALVSIVVRNQTYA